MKVLGRVISAFLGAVLLSVIVISAVVAGLGFWSYKNPKSAFRLIESYVLPTDLKIDWQTVAFSGKWLGGVDFQIDLTLKNLEISKASPQLDLPIVRVQVRASVFPLRRAALIHLAQVIASKPLVYVAEKSSKPEQEKNPFERIQSILEILVAIHERVPIESVDLQAEKFEFRAPEGDSLVLKIDLNQEPRGPLKIIIENDEVNSSKKKSATTFSVNGHLDFLKMKRDEPFLDVRVKFEGFGVTTDQHFFGSSTSDSVRLITSGPFEYRKDKMRLEFNPTLTMTFHSDSAQLDLRGPVKGLPDSLLKIKTVAFEMNVPLESGQSWSSQPSRFKLAVPVELFFVAENQRKKLEASCGCKLPTTVLAEASGQLWVDRLLSRATARRPVLNAEIKVESLRNKMFAIDLAGRLEIEKEADLFRFSPYLNSRATVLSLQAIRPMLEAYKVLLPAPLDVLDGTLAFSAIGPFQTLETASTFPMSLEVDLASSTQKVKVNTDATVRLDKQLTAAHFDVSAIISALNIDLPPLDPLGGLPRVTLDSRFKNAPDDKKIIAPKFKLSFNFEFATESDGAIRLRSKYFAPYLPLTLKVQSNGAKENSGFIQSEAFDVTYLRRTVRVEGVRIGLDSDDQGVFPLKGRISVKQTDYTVFIDVEGTTKSPNVTMSSDPYLPQTDIIAVLLYDRVNDQLVSGDAEAAGGVKAAIADRAIGLFGLWAFAATPIKSFSYNPVSKVYTATVAVSDDLTAGIGTNWEESAHLELRKRVSKRWSLTAAFTPASQDESSTTKLVLQWEKRF